MVQRVTQVNPRLILGKGKVAELEVLALQGRAGMLVFDGELSPRSCTIWLTSPNARSLTAPNLFWIFSRNMP